jgi:hypothetical protein
MVRVPSVHNGRRKVDGRVLEEAEALVLSTKTIRSFSRNLRKETCKRRRDLHGLASLQNGTAGNSRHVVHEGAKLGSFNGDFSEKNQEIFEKDLALRSERNSLFLPFDERLPRQVADGIEGGVGGVAAVLSPKLFSKVIGKRIDGGPAEVLVETLSLNGKLFEIYFVRLIGTPNQQFKKWYRSKDRYRC